LVRHYVNATNALARLLLDWLSLSANRRSSEVGLEESSRRGPSIRWVAALVAVAFLAGALSGGLVSLLVDGDVGSGNTSRDEEGSVAAVTARVIPSVVTVINEITPSATYPNGGVGGGGGVFVDDRGYVLTNAHIASIPGKLNVVLHDGEIRAASLVSHDAPFSDLALIRVQGRGFKALPFADSDTLRQGETVIAIGSPDVDYRNSVSSGVISGLHRRKLLDDLWLDDLIQTDAAINVGNSGGPLINLDGEIAGLITFRDIGADEPLFGISFALSSNSVEPIVKSMIDRGSYARPYFGVEHQDIDDKLLATGAVRIDHGALVSRVIGGSPAQAAGLRMGDVILRIGQTDINADNTFLNALGRVGANERVPVQYWREGRTFEVTLETTAR
jgi:2-alkenal reductase